MRIAEQLADPGCRLLSLIAPGGMGKTSLALAVAKGRQDMFADGVFFVPFATVQSPEQMVFALADAIGLTPRNQYDAKKQLFAYLADKHMLLVMDNLEHLLEGVALFSDLLEAAPNIKILATSREQLRLRSEWVIDLRGLSYPGRDSANPEAYDAMKFFADSAKRVQADFVLDSTALSLPIHLCQLVEGMPLAIELAASWLRVLNLQDIVQEIKQSLDFLESPLQDVPERQQSIRAVFDYSWQLLDTTEQNKLAALSIFQGSFDRDAAQAVAATSTRDLLSLSSKSLLRRQTTGRFDLHPLIKQYAFEKLQSHRHKETLEKYRTYYLALFQGQIAELHLGKQKEVLEMLDLSINDFLVVWEWALKTQNQDETHLWMYYSLRNRYQEGSVVLQAIIDGIDASDSSQRVPLARVLASQAWLEHRLSNNQKAEELSRRSIKLLKKQKVPLEAVRPLVTLGMTQTYKGNYGEARACFEEAIQLARQRVPQYLAFCYQHLCILEQREGNFEEAERLIRDALKIYRKAKDYSFIVSCLQALGSLLRRRGRLEESQTLLLEGLELSQRLGLQMTTPYLLNSLGEVARDKQDYTEAKSYFEKALMLVKESGDKGLQAFFLENLAELAALQTHDDEAEAHYRQALKAAWYRESALDALLNSVDVIKSIARFWAERGRVANALSLLSLYAKHEAMPAAEQARLHALIGNLKEDVTKDVFEIAIAKAQELNLEDVTDYLTSTETAFDLPGRVKRHA